MKRNVSFNGEVGKRDVSFDGAPDADTGGMRRTDSSVWDWKAASPPVSRGNSVNGGNAFNPESGMLKRNLSFVWDWAIGRKTPPVSRGASLHGGAAFAPDQQMGDASMRRNDSSVWDWKASTPPASRGNSLHGGGAFKPEEAHAGSYLPGPGEQGYFEWAWGKSASLWDWSSSRGDSRGTSLHGGSAFDRSREEPGKQHSVSGD